MYRKKYHIHFVGVGGIGMSGIAELLLNLGYQVSGSDLKSSDITRRLASLGGTITTGHTPEHVAGADVVVVSSAVSWENPEVAAARDAGIPVIPRAEMLAELMRLKYSIAVAGAHGKTTTTSLVAEVLNEAGLSPTVVIGGKLRGLGVNAVLGKGEFLVAEADESDGSFLKMAPSIAVVTNIDREHVDHYPDLASVKNAFLLFLDRVPFYGVSVLCLDNPAVQDLIPQVSRRYLTYGLSPQADVRAKDVEVAGSGTDFTAVFQGQDLFRVRLGIPGRHNVVNSLAAVAVGLELSIPPETICAALTKVRGVGRRLEVMGETCGVLVLDDYGHHPTEIMATLAAVRDCWPGRRVLVVFQPHRYTRTSALMQDFSRAFYQADKLLVLPVYPAGEEPIPGADHESLCESIKNHGHKNVSAAWTMEEAVEKLTANARENDIVLTLGAGDVFKVGTAFLERKASGQNGTDGPAGA
ncbi:MAG: UDP-N-acetylmuramate--L-alanine ligase [Thermodesulfobacteriota bacterium]